MRKGIIESVITERLHIDVKHNAKKKKTKTRIDTNCLQQLLQDSTEIMQVITAATYPSTMQMKPTTRLRVLSK